MIFRSVISAASSKPFHSVHLSTHTTRRPEASFLSRFTRPPDSRVLLKPSEYRSRSAFQAFPLTAPIVPAGSPSLLAGMSFISLFTISFVPIIKVALLCLTGAAATHLGLIDATGRKQLSMLIFYVFSPALLFIKLAAAITWEHLLAWLPILWLTWLGIVVGLGVGNVLGRVLDFPPFLRSVATACISLANTGNLPLVIVASLAMDPASPFHGLESLGIAYVGLAMFAQTVIFFSLGYTLMKRPEDVSPAPAAAAQPPRPSPRSSATQSQLELNVMSYGRREGQPLSDNGGQSRTSPSAASVSSRLPGIPEAEDCGAGAAPPPQTSALVDDREALLSSPSIGIRISSDDGGASAGEPNGKSAGGTDGASGQPLSDTATAQDGTNGREDPAIVPPVPSVLDLIKSIKLSDVFTPPNRASFAALIIGCIPPLKNLFFSAPGSPHLAPLEFITSTVNILADATVPCMMIVLGSLLAKGPGAGHVPNKTMAGILLGRLIIVPLIGTAVTMLLRVIGLLRFPDPFFALVVLLNFATPTAINIQTLATLHGYCEQEVSAVLFYQYLAATLTLPIFIALSLVIAT